MLFESMVEALSPSNLLYVMIGVLGGCLVGAIPGMTSVMLIAIALPFTYKMPAAGAIIMMISICSGANYGGGISAILFNMPGTPSAAATALDGFPMSQKGRGGEALLANIFASFIGGCIAWVIMIFATGAIAKFALKFGPTEYCMLMVCSFTIIGMLAAEDPLKGITSGVFGLLLSCIGLDTYAAKPRYVFGQLYLYEGIDTVWASIGIFAFVQIFKFITSKQTTFAEKTESGKGDWPVWKTLKETVKKPVLLLQSTIIGTFIGAAPGAGPSIASFLSYGVAKRTSKHPDDFGKGFVDGVIASEAANNACGFGSLVPMLSLGVPGSTSAALMMTAMSIVGLRAGPELFTKNVGQVYTIYTGALLSNFAFLIVGLIFAKRIAKLLHIKLTTMLPIITVLASFGVYAPDQAVFGLFIAYFFGVVCFLLDKWGVPLTPMLLGIVLGRIMENHFLRAMIITKNDLLLITHYSPLSTVFSIITVISIISIVISHNEKLKFWKKQRNSE